MLKFRGDLHYFNVPLADKLSKKMMTYANVLRTTKDMSGSIPGAGNKKKKCKLTA